MANVDEINQALITGDTEFLSERLVATGTTSFHWVIKFLVTESKSLHGTMNLCTDGDSYPNCTGAATRVNANHHANFNNGHEIDSIMIK